MSFEEYDCGSSFSPNMFCLCAHPCRVIRHQNKRTNKTREPFAHHSRTTRKRFANDAEYFRDRIRFQHEPNHSRTCILAESNPFLIVRPQFRYAAPLFVRFCGAAGSFLFGCTQWCHMSCGSIRRGALAGTTARCDAHL